MKRTQKYPLHQVQALIFQDRKEASDFIKANKDRLHEFSIQTIGPPVVLLLVWKK